MQLDFLFFFFFFFHGSMKKFNQLAIKKKELLKIFRLTLLFRSPAAQQPYPSALVSSSTLTDGFRTRPIRGVQGGEAPWLGRLGKVLLVRIVKNAVVYSFANSLTPSIGKF